MDFGRVAIDSTDSNFVPPDPELAMGPSHAIAAVNSSFRIFDATTGNPLTGAINFSFLFSATSSCGLLGAEKLFDPNAIYDEQAGRFIPSGPMPMARTSASRSL